MVWVWVGIFVQLFGRFWDASYHATQVLEDTKFLDSGIPFPHYIEFLGVIIVAVAVLRKRSFVFRMILLGSLIKITGWLWDSIFVHLPGLADPYEYSVPHTSMLVGFGILFIFTLVALFQESSSSEDKLQEGQESMGGQGSPGSQGDQDAAARQQEKKVKLVFTSIIIGIVLTEIDHTIVATSMINIVGDLGQFSLYSWVFSIYLFTTTVMLLLSGKMADVFGKKRMFIISLSIFILGSILCGFSTNMVELIIYRGLQGIGAGLFFPIPLIMIADLFPPAKLGRMQGMLGVIIGLSIIFGPVLGGLITDYLSWHWVFFINIPLGIASLVLLGIAYQEEKSTVKHAMDYLGAGVFMLAILLILFSFSFLNFDMDHRLLYMAVTLFAGLVMMILFLQIQHKAKEPMVPLAVFKNRAINVVSLLCFFVGGTLYGVITYVPLFLQTVWGVSPLRSGIFLGVLIIGMISASFFIGQLLVKMAFRNLILLCLICLTLSFGVMSLMDGQTSIHVIIMAIFMTGLSFGVLVPTFTVMMQTSISKEWVGLSTSFSIFFRHIGGFIGVSLMGALMVYEMGSIISFDEIQMVMNKKVALAAEIVPQVAQSINATFMICLIFAVVSIGITLFIKKNLRMPT